MFRLNLITFLFAFAIYQGNFISIHLQGFSQAIVLENPGIPSGDYVTNGAAWQFQLPESYDPMNAGGPECVNCSTSQSAYWRRAEGGHSLCHQCSYTRQTRVNKIPKNKTPVVSKMRHRPQSISLHAKLILCRFAINRQRVIVDRESFVPIARQAQQHCGDETIKVNQCAMHVVSTINYIM